MTPTSSAVLALFGAFAVLTALAGAVLTARTSKARRAGTAAAATRRSVGRHAATGLCLLLSPVLAAGACLVAVNQQVQMFTRWSQFGGNEQVSVGAPVSATSPLGASPHAPGTGPVRGVTRSSGASHSSGGSEIRSVVVPGTRSGINLQAYVYLPAAYFAPSYARTRFPAIEGIAGFPGSPQSWLNTLDFKARLDSEIASGRMPPMVLVFPMQQLIRFHDPECVDPAHGPRFGTFLSTDVLTYTKTHFRVRTDRDGWGVMGYSTGGFCAVDLAFRHPSDYSAAASLSGYFTPVTDRTTGPLYAGKPRLRLANDPLWQIRHGHIPDLALFLASGGSDGDSVPQIHAFDAALRPPLSATTVVLPTGGHSFAVWAALCSPMLDWFAAHLAQPTPPAPVLGGSPGLGHAHQSVFRAEASSPVTGHGH